MVSALWAILALFGLDWEIVAGRLKFPPLTRRNSLFVGLVVASLVVSSEGWYVASAKNDPFHFNKDTPTEVISDKIFADQVVPLDGKEYRYCKFYNVKFLYNGLTPAKLNHDTFSGSILLNTENPAVAVAWGLTRAMGFSNVPLYDMDMRPLDDMMPPTRTVIPPQPRRAPNLQHRQVHINCSGGRGRFLTAASESNTPLHCEQRTSRKPTRSSS